MENNLKNIYTYIYIRIYITKSLNCVPETNTIL